MKRARNLLLSSRRLAACTVAVAITLLVRDVRAAGLFVSDRGVRPLSRGGAFVAGADDLGAIWYNPAGIVEAPSSVLVDGSWVGYSSTFTRQVQTTSSTGTAFTTTLPAVNGTTPFLPIPTIAGSYRWGGRQEYAVAAGVFAPYAALLTYPETVGGQPAPSRYSLLSLDGSLLSVIGAWFSYAPAKELRVGAGVELLTGVFKTTVDFSACPPQNLFCAGEDPNYDAFSAVKAGPIFAPSANAGITYIPVRELRFGASVQGPFTIDAPATIDVRLPTSAEFDSAYQQGHDAHMHFQMPPVVRAGIELRPLEDDALRVEVAYVREFWSVHDSIDLTPEDMKLYGIAGLPSPFGVAPISLPRHFQDAQSVRAGGEYAFEAFGFPVRGRAGVSYETSAVPTAYESPLTIDANKVQVTLGGGVQVTRHLRLDLVVAHTFAPDVTVSPQEAAVPKVNPVQGNPTQTPAANAGTYGQSLDVIGGGLEYRF
jgi:long-chain fatty acid transport protein